MIDLRSDTFTLPTPAMLRAMAAAELGDDTYGEDPTVKALERRAAGMLGKEAGCFVPSGTMGNLACILAQAPRGTKAVVGEESDIYIYEAGGASVCGGVVYHPLPNQEDGSIALGDLQTAFPDDREDPQFALPSLLCLENPQNRCGGRVLSTGYLAEVTAFARQRDITVHMDGSRIFNASVGSGTPVEVIAGYADTVQFCLSKGLCAPVGSIVVGSERWVRSVRRIRKMLGGGMRQAGVLAAAGIVALEEMVDRLAEDHANARCLAAELARLPGIAVDPSRPETNMVYFQVDAPGLDNGRFISAVARHGIRLAELGHGRIRAVTHAGVARADVERAVSVFALVMENLTGKGESR
jgi:threonine aldolase